MKRAALIVGNNQYEDPAIRPLLFAEQDATELYGFFKRSAPYDDVRLLQHAEDDEVLNCAGEMVRALGPGDLFVFYYAGHGLTHEGRHLLLCPKARLKRLNFFHHTVPVDLLKDETAADGLQRVFILDACRSDLRHGRAAGGEGFRGESVLRDIVCAPAARPSPLALLCSCAEGRQALESTQLKQGLFSRALLEEFEDALRGEVELRLGETLQQNLRKRMDRLAAQAGVQSDQRPWVQLSDVAPVLIPGRRGVVQEKVATPASPSADAAATRAARELCPACGLRNEPDETFRCRLCGRDYLCRDHFVKTERCCEECAEKLARERADAESKAREEAARLVELRRQQEEERKRAETGRRRREEEARGKAEEEARRARQPKAGHPWENSLGVKFVPVPGTKVLFCIWETRVQDFEAFVKATGHDATPGMYSLKSGSWGQHGHTWNNPGFDQGPTHPVVGVNWDDAQAFCAWLTEKERQEDLLGAGHGYRLPADADWSWAVGIGEREESGTPKDKDMKLKDVYPWGTQWPPPKGAGNYCDETCHRNHKDWAYIQGYDDGYEYTSPVGSFAANQFGLYDLGGNAWEWCEDWYDPSEAKYRVLRGASWSNDYPDYLLSSYRRNYTPDYRGIYIGFRVVLAGGSLG